MPPAKKIPAKKAQAPARKAPAKKKTRTPMSARHKAALAVGRDEGRKVRIYLEALASQKPKRGRKRTAASIERRLAAMTESLPDAAPLQRLHLAQEQVDLERELHTFGDLVDVSAAEADFVAVAHSYADRKGISYAAWRAVGVPASVLKQAGIGRGA